MQKTEPPASGCGPASTSTEDERTVGGVVEGSRSVAKLKCIGGLARATPEGCDINPPAVINKALRLKNRQRSIVSILPPISSKHVFSLAACAGYCPVVMRRGPLVVPMRVLKVSLPTGHYVARRKIRRLAHIASTSLTTTIPLVPSCIRMKTCKQQPLVTGDTSLTSCSVSPAVIPGEPVWFLLAICPLGSVNNSD